MGPHYSVKFRSNFEPFVPKRYVKHDDDEDITREPEMVKPWRATGIERIRGMQVDVPP